VVLLGALALLAVGTGLTVIFGRVWCGWSCPQTVVPLLARWAAAAFPRGLRAPARGAFVVVGAAAFSFLLVCGFLPPGEAARAVVRSPVAGLFWLSLFVWHLVMFGVLGTLFCRTVCPYAMLQNLFFDRDTLVVAYDKNRDADCFRDALCARVCPAGIDIRGGLGRECIACAACIDACERVTAARRVPSFVAWRGRILRPKAALWGAIGALSLAAFAAAAAARPPVEFSVQWQGPAGPPGVQRYAYAVRNNTSRPFPAAIGLEGGRLLGGGRTLLAPPRTRVAGILFAVPQGRRMAFSLAGPGAVRRFEVPAP